MNKYDSKHKQLTELIGSLLTKKLDDDNDVEYVKSELEQIYSEEDYRHRYSDIFATLSRIIDNEDNKSILQMWLERIKSMDFDERIKPKISKFYDHILLDINRTDYISNLMSKTKLEYDGKLLEAVAKVNTLTGNLKQSEIKLKKVEQKLQKSQMEVITILGIFAGIVITFNSGISFITSSFSALKEAPFFKLSVMICFSGIIIISILYVLFDLIATINNNENHLSANVVIKINFGLLLSAIALIVFSCLYKY